MWCPPVQFLQSPHYKIFQCTWLIEAYKLLGWVYKISAFELKVLEKPVWQKALKTNLFHVSVGLCCWETSLMHWSLLLSCTLSAFVCSFGDIFKFFIYWTMGILHIHKLTVLPVPVLQSISSNGYFKNNILWTLFNRNKGCWSNS